MEAVELYEEDIVRLINEVRRKYDLSIEEDAALKIAIDIITDNVYEEE